ncbi:hypothetical protein HY995_04380 [Candidatus Micrarchaeota archaeon]|nr:hypothetical protein [Candidatus Micrarchaeota archaeon]MBI5177292.1 hypothetical protein [Candidatus Micrarchaeota archaeon]
MNKRPAPEHNKSALRVLGAAVRKHGSFSAIPQELKRLYLEEQERRRGTLIARRTPKPTLTPTELEMLRKYHAAYEQEGLMPEKSQAPFPPAGLREETRLPASMEEFWIHQGWHKTLANGTVKLTNGQWTGLRTRIHAIQTLAGILGKNPPRHNLPRLQTKQAGGTANQLLRRQPLQSAHRSGL